MCPDEGWFIDTGSFIHRRAKKDSPQHRKQWMPYGYFCSNVQKLCRSQYNHRLEKKCSPSNKHTGGKEVLQITMICVCRSAGSVGNLKEQALKGTAVGFHSWRSCKLSARAFHSWDKLSPALKDLMLAPIDKQIFSWSPLHRTTDSISSSTAFVSHSNSEEIRKFSECGS